MTDGHPAGRPVLPTAAGARSRRRPLAALPPEEPSRTDERVLVCTLRAPGPTAWHDDDDVEGELEAIRRTGAVPSVHVPAAALQFLSQGTPKGIFTPGLERAAVGFGATSILVRDLELLGGSAAEVASRLGIPWAAMVLNWPGGRPGSRRSEHLVHTARRARALFVPDSGTARWLRDVLRLSNVCELPIGTVRPTTEDLTAPRPAEHVDTHLVLTADRCREVRELTPLFEAVREVAVRIPSTRAMILTERPKAVNRLAARVGIRDHLVPLASDPADAVRRWMIWSDVFALPRWDRPSLRLAAQAVTVGCPVILPAHHGLAPRLRGFGPGAGQSASHGWILGGAGTAEIEAALIEALNRPRERAMLGRACRQHGEMWQSWKRLGVVVMKGLAEGPDADATVQPLTML